MATATEEVLADLVDRADRAIQRWLDRAISSVQEAIAPILEEALFLGEARTSLDSETAREELRRLLAETTFHGGYLMEQPELPDVSVTPEQDFLRQLQHRQFDDRVTVHPRDPATGRWLTEGEAELVRLMGNLQGGQPLTLPQGTTVHYVRPNPNLAALSRLLWLLDLSERERAFVRAAADEPCDLDGLAVFADWLEERQRTDGARFREVAAAGIRRLNPQPGEVYVIRTPPTGSLVQDDFVVAYLRGLWEGIANDATLIMLPPDESLSRLTDEQLAAAGLVRKDGLAEREKE
jgi:uncharacterized protein (TIGR02996 family)